jgi:hypothetical protein
MPKASKKNVKPLDPNKPSYKQPAQHNVEKAQEKDKIKPDKIFEMMGGKKTKKKVGHKYPK